MDPQKRGQFLILCPDTQDLNNNTGPHGYKSDFESFASVSSFVPTVATVDQAEIGTEDDVIRVGRKGNRSRGRRIRFQDVHIEDGEVGCMVIETPRSLESDDNDKCRGTAISDSESEGHRLEEKADFSSGQSIISSRDDIVIGGGERHEDPMKGRHISRSNSMMMVGFKADDLPPYQSGVLGLNSNREKEELMDVDARVLQVQEGGPVQTNRICRSLSETSIEIPSSSSNSRELTSTPTRNHSRLLPRKVNTGISATIDPLSSQPAPQRHLPLAPVIQSISCECGRAIDLPPPPLVIPAAAAHFRDPRQRQFTFDEPISPTQIPVRPASSYFVPLSSFLPSSYQTSLSSWRDSFIAPSYASLLSSHIHIGNAEDDADDEEVVGLRDEPAESVQASSNFPKEGRFPALGYNINNHNSTTSRGVTATAERLAGLAMSTGQATLDYVKDTIAPSAIHLAHRSASSTIGFLTSHIPGPSTVPSMLPRFLGDVINGRQGTSTNNPGTNHPGPGVGGSGVPERRRSHSTMDGLGLGDRMSRSAPSLTNTKTGEPVIPAAVFQRSTNPPSTSLSKTRVATLVTTAPPATTSAAMMTTNQPRRARRTTLQTIPGPEGLNPETRRQLETQGLAALGLRAESADQGWRNWWDPRRYGLPKYIICHHIRTPRPCTTILFLILIVCIVFPVVFRRK
ncbi:hypothetical protein BGZ96_001496 [Linnemannia gamsii]|uniref:Uncharacterized protein n=1 Tax=Linnemannia gamsii TaxID=64522 RepID=A0ABQ7KAH9_9FUNG|nr:hypothetical protein BGZ96_001496 [Linnemannia gamsii]